MKHEFVNPLKPIGYAEPEVLQHEAAVRLFIGRVATLVDELDSAAMSVRADSPATARHPCGRDCTGTEHRKVALRRQGDHSLAMVAASGSYRSTRHPTRLGPYSRRRDWPRWRRRERRISVRQPCAEPRRRNAHGTHQRCFGRGSLQLHM